MTTRTLQRVIESMPTSDGAGVKLRRSLGRPGPARLDPFLMLDEFSSDNPDDYIAGFPTHPHRGFETVTYMLDGHMLHEDHLGNRGDLKSGDVQWMTAGPRHHPLRDAAAGARAACAASSSGSTCRRSEKMKPAGYRDIQPRRFRSSTLPGGGRVEVIAGTLEVDGRATPGPDAGRQHRSAVLRRRAAGRRALLASASSPTTTRSSIRTKAASRSALRAPRAPLEDAQRGRAVRGRPDRGQRRPRTARASSCSPGGRCASPSCSTARS